MQVATNSASTDTSFFTRAFRNVSQYLDDCGFIRELHKLERMPYVKELCKQLKLIPDGGFVDLFTISLKDTDDKLALVLTPSGLKIKLELGKETLSTHPELSEFDREGYFALNTHHIRVMRTLGLTIEHVRRELY